jgi:hypothetical protein
MCTIILPDEIDLGKGSKVLTDADVIVTMILMVITIKVMANAPFFVVAI